MSGTQRIVNERVRQTQVEKFTDAADDHYVDNELLRAAKCYLDYAQWQYLCPRRAADEFPRNRLLAWPWDTSWWKPVNSIRALEKAGALIAAEIDRLERSQKANNTQSGQPHPENVSSAHNAPDNAPALPDA